jgi:hypothetical protein
MDQKAYVLIDSDGCGGYEVDTGEDFIFTIKGENEQVAHRSSAQSKAFLT